jgi:soluble lytic murein transglycosylase-like protein
MRALRLFGLAFGLMTSAAAGAQMGKPVRTAVLISMTDAPRAPESAMTSPARQGAVEVGASGVLEGPSPSAGFRVHDLSRRWVEYQMASAFTPLPAEMADASEDPFAPVGMAQPQVTLLGAEVAPASAIPVPLWMRGGSAFAAAAATYVPGCVPTDYRPSGLLTGDAEYRRRGYYGLMANIACQYGIPVGLFDAMIIRESRYNAAVYSPKNAFGLTQLMPDTAAGLGVNRYNVEQNLRGGARYLREQLDRFGQYHLALAAYNAGPGRVRNGAVPPFAETQAYVSNILLNWSKLSGLPATAQGETGGFRTSGAPTTARGAVVTSF